MDLGEINSCYNEEFADDFKYFHCRGSNGPWSSLTPHHSARPRPKSSITLSLHSSYRISIVVVLIMHSLLSHSRFSEGTTTVKPVTDSLQLCSKRMHDNIRRNKMQSAQNTLKRSHTRPFLRSSTDVHSLQPIHIVFIPSPLCSRSPQTYASQRIIYCIQR